MVWTYFNPILNTNKSNYYLSNNNIYIDVSFYQIMYFYWILYRKDSIFVSVILDCFIIVIYYKDCLTQILDNKNSFFCKTMSATVVQFQIKYKNKKYFKVLFYTDNGINVLNQI